MKGVSDMKNLINILKLVLYYILGYLVFTFIIFLVELILLNILSSGVNNFGELYLKSINGNLLAYTITYLVIFIFNLLYNFISIKRLNAKENNNYSFDFNINNCCSTVWRT